MITIHSRLCSRQQLLNIKYKIHLNGTLKIDLIEQLIILISDYIKRLLLY